jgi:signal transduction histidine kinase
MAKLSTTDVELPPVLGWRRLGYALLFALLVSLPLNVPWTGSYLVLLVRLLIASIALLLVFGLFERWPAQAPPWLERWALQVLGVALAVPFAVMLAYLLTSAGYETSFWRDKQRLNGFGMILGAMFLLAPWAAMLGLLRQVTGRARNRALAFELERSELERQALDARMRVLQAQVEPHFLFNTLANVRELVDSGSPQASAVLGHLIAYLRAAVPRLQGTSATLGNEVDLVRAYLELMQMRMPDRLQFLLHADEAALSLPFPAMALLTLVENAVRHGIDPSEVGGRIEVRVSVHDGHCRAQVIDTGIGLRESNATGTGTGLANLRERMKLIHGDRAAVRLSPVSPHGTSAELEFPVDGASP